MIDLEAVKMGLRGQPKSELPSFTNTLAKGWPYLFPIFILIALLVIQYTPQTACIISIISLVLVSYWKSDIKLGWIPIAIGLGLMFTGIMPPEVASVVTLADVPPCLVSQNYSAELEEIL